MNALDVLVYLKKFRVLIDVKNGRLWIDAPKGFLDDTTREFIREHKKDMIALLTAAPPAADTTDTTDTTTADEESDRESFEERAAIMEFDGHMTRAEAEAAAMALMTAVASQDTPQDDSAVKPCPTPPVPDSAPQGAPHPTPPVPAAYRWQGEGPLHRLQAEPDDSRRRCAYCGHFHPITIGGRLKPWCARFDEWRDPGILHQCNEFEFEPGALERND